MNTINIVVVDDSTIVQFLLEKILTQQQGMKLVGQAYDGTEGVALVKKLSPHVVVMDINMPGMDGLEAIQEIMIEKPTPIIVFSSASDEIVDLSFKSIELGAVDIIEKPFSKDYDSLRQSIEQKLLRSIKTFSDFKVIRRLRKTTSFFLREKADKLKIINERMKIKHEPARIEKNIEKPTKQLTTVSRSFPVIGIATSTGGPQTVRKLVENEYLKKVNAGIVIVQHIGEGFIEGFCDWLNTYSHIPVQMAPEGDPVKANHIYIAPSSHHLGFTSEGKFLYIKEPPILGIRPSANILFKHMAKTFKERVIVMILTGMGNDGIASLCIVKEKGGFVLTQDKESSILYGMPKAAVESGVVDKVLPLSEIPNFLVNFCSEKVKND